MRNGGPKKYLLGGGGGGLWWGSCDKLSTVIFFTKTELERGGEGVGTRSKGRERRRRRGGRAKEALTGKLRTREAGGERNE